jgi:hypothetical protein
VRVVQSDLRKPVVDHVRQATSSIPVGICQLFAQLVFGFSLSTERVLALFREDSEPTQLHFLAYNGALRDKCLALDHTFNAAKCVHKPVLLPLPGERRVSLFRVVLASSSMSMVRFAPTSRTFHKLEVAAGVCRSTGLKEAYNQVVAKNGPGAKIIGVIFRDTRRRIQLCTRFFARRKCRIEQKPRHIQGYCDR